MKQSVNGRHRPLYYVARSAPEAAPGVAAFNFAEYRHIRVFANVSLFRNVANTRPECVRARLRGARITPRRVRVAEKRIRI